MIIRVRKPISCTDSAMCGQNIATRIQAIMPTVVNGKQVGHIHIKHIQNNHLIIVAAYDADEKFETVSREELVTNTTKPDIVLSKEKYAGLLPIGKFPTTKPTVTDIANALAGM